MRVLITGMSGTGKPAVVSALLKKDIDAIPLDERGCCEWQTCEGSPTGARDGVDWVWNK